MKDILLKRNELKNKSTALKLLKFDDNLKYEQTKKLEEEQDKMFNKWNFYDKFIKAREVVKK